MLLKDKNVIEADSISINTYACTFLAIDNIPPKIHALLQTIFTKRKSDYRHVFMLTEQGDGKLKHHLKVGCSAIVGNVLILVSLLGTSSTKKLLDSYFQRKYSTKKIIFNQYFKDLNNQTESCFFCGVNDSHLIRIKSRLNNQSFDLLTEKLPNPFQSKNYIVHILTKDIPWQEYLSKFKIAEQAFYQKDIFSAKSLLTELNNTAIIELAPAQRLLTKVNADIKEAEDALNLINNLLN